MNRIDDPRSPARVQSEHARVCRDACSARVHSRCTRAAVLQYNHDRARTGVARLSRCARLRRRQGSWRSERGAPGREQDVRSQSAAFSRLNFAAAARAKRLRFAIGTRQRTRAAVAYAAGQRSSSNSRLEGPNAGLVLVEIKQPGCAITHDSLPRSAPTAEAAVPGDLGHMWVPCVRTSRSGPGRSRRRFPRLRRRSRDFCPVQRRSAAASSLGLSRKTNCAPRYPRDPRARAAQCPRAPAGRRITRQADHITTWGCSKRSRTTLCWPEIALRLGEVRPDLRSTQESLLNIVLRCYDRNRRGDLHREGRAGREGCRVRPRRDRLNVRPGREARRCRSDRRRSDINPAREALARTSAASRNFLKPRRPVR